MGLNGSLGSCSIADSLSLNLYEVRFGKKHEALIGLDGQEAAWTQMRVEKTEPFLLDDMFIPFAGKEYHLGEFQ